MKRFTCIFSLIVILLLWGCSGNSKSTKENEIESKAVQTAEEAKKDSEAARKSAEAIEEEINQILD